MATSSEENDLIGYDPLAWIEGNAGKNEETIDNGYCDSENSPEGTTCDNEIRMADDSIGTPEEVAILNIITGDESVIVVIEDENDTVLVEEMVNDCMEAGGSTTQGAVAEESASEETEEGMCDLDATLTIQNVVKLHEKLKNLVAVHDQIEINASDVSSIDTATLQLLVSLKKDADKLNKKVTIIYPSPRFVESAKLLGLLDVLDVEDA
jgi:anti-anti-sigma regulatory factor